MLFAIDLHEDFIDEEGIAVAMMLSLQSPGEPGTELDTPEPNGFVGDCDASLSKQIFDITVAEVESEVKPDCIADDLRWEPVTFVDIHSGIIHFRELSCQYGADGIYSGLRADRQRLCALVIVAVNARGDKHFLAIEDGIRESTQSWREVLLDLKTRGMNAPELAVGDGALGFWAALEEVFPATRQQRCWMHKTGNVLNAMPKSVQPKAKSALHEIWQAEIKDQADKAFDRFIATYEAKYPKATGCLAKDRDELLAFYDFPAAHWQHLRTSNPIESTFATIRLRTAKTRNCVSAKSGSALLYQLAMSAQKRWRRLRGFRQLADVIAGVKFIDGIDERTINSRKAA